MRAAAGVAVALLTFAGPAAAWAPMPPLEAVFEAPGMKAREMSGKGSACIAQTLKPGLANAPTITSSDLEGGRIVANNYYQGEDGVRMRSTLTFEAKDGRFRITHSDVEAFIQKWSQVGAVDGRGPPATITELTAISERIADCVRAKPDNW